MKAKRLFDIFFSTFALLIFAPLGLLIAVSVKLADRGAIFYHSGRIGLAGAPFLCPKFRTMRQDISLSTKARLKWACFHKIKEDPRVTRMGRWLRKSSLDELPQLWCVWQGSMSLVGPRPYLIEELDELKALLSPKELHELFSCKPGLAGLWQASGRSLLPFSERVRLDHHYALHQSFFFDLKLLVKTIFAWLRGQGAY